jgi:hypothetical protein
LHSIFAKSPKILEKIDALYLKEFAISNEKRTAITDIYSTYDKKRGKQEALPDNSKYPMFTDTFNKEDVWFSGEAMEASLLAMSEKSWSAMDKNILQKVMTKNNIVIDNFITKNTKGENVVDGNAIINSGKKELLVKCMLKDADVWKGVKTAYDKTADQHYPKKAGEKIADNKQRLANGDDVALIFSAYAVGGSKGNFYNVLTENKLFDKNTTKQNNIKEENEANEKLSKLKEKNDRV